MPYDKLFGNVELPKALIQSQGLNVYEALFSDNHHPYCVIEFLVNNQDIYLKMSSSVEKYNKLEHPHLLKIFYWSYEFLLAQNEKIYKFYFVTDHFDKDVKSWLNERSASKLFLFERDLYKIARDLASLVQYIAAQNLPINPLKRETLVVSNNKLKLIPHIFLLEIMEEMSKIKLLSQISQKKAEESIINFFESNLSKMKQYASSTEEIIKILDQTNAGRIGSPTNGPDSMKNASSSPKKSVFKKQEGAFRSSMTNSMTLNNKSPQNSLESPLSKKSVYSASKAKNSSGDKSTKEEEKSAILAKMKECQVSPQDRIYSLGMIIAMLAVLYDSDDEDPDKILSPANVKEMEKKFGKEFVALIRKILQKNKNISLNEVIEEISYLIKVKGNEDGLGVTDKKKKGYSSIVKINLPPDRRIRFLHCFPELYQKMLYVNIQDKVQTFFEVQDLNVDFIIPVDHRTISLFSKDQYLIYLMGGKNTNNVYMYNPEKKLLEQKENMIGTLERRSFGICSIKNMIYVSGGYLDNEITKSVECFDVMTNYWCKLKPLNEPCTDNTLCSYNEKYLFKFGGQMITFTLCQIIEKYDVGKDKWHVVNYNVEAGLKDSFAFLRNSLSTQISEDEILIIGGINVYYEGTNRCYLLKVKEVEDKIKKEGQNILTLMKEKKKETEFAYEICHFSSLNLPTKDPLELCPPIIVDDELFILQFKKNNHRKLISLGKDWKEMKDIKW